MIHPTSIRDALEASLAGADLGRVYSLAPVGVIELPCVVVGMPRWRAWAESGMDVYEVPIVVCVAMNGGDPAVSVQELDDLWPLVVVALQQVAAMDQTLGGICADAVVDSATYGSVRIGAQDYPSYHINLKLYSTQ